jgi:hypothetical protein
MDQSEHLWMDGAIDFQWIESDAQPQPVPHGTHSGGVLLRLSGTNFLVTEIQFDNW